MHVRTLFAISLIFTVSMTCSGFAAQQQSQNAQSAQELQLLQIARQTATIAGGARYCKLDIDDIEEFIGKADARIVLLARDDYQKILGRLEFKNILAAASAKEPTEGCKKLEDQFNTILRESR